jgi:hypothetical protein
MLNLPKNQLPIFYFLLASPFFSALAREEGKASIRPEQSHAVETDRLK